METTTIAPGGAPKPQTDAERQLVQLLEGGQVRTEFARELLQGMGETREAAQAVMASVESEPDKRVSFAEAVKLLDGKLDLEAARTDAVKSHGRWGLVDALVKAGAIKDASEYGALFDKATVSEADLKRVSEMAERGEKVLPIFDSGEMTPDELFAVLFTEGGVPHYTDSYGFKNLAKLRRIDPKDIHDLANLAGKSYDEQVAAFKAAYKEADPMEPTGARVLFTSDKREVTRTGTSATQDMQAFAKGEMSFLDPNADFLRYRAQMGAGLRKIAGRRGNFDGMTDEDYRAFLDKAFAYKTIDEYMPDREKITRYPNYAYENGGVPFLCFNVNYRWVVVHYYDPAYAADFLGSRLSLG
ncbi:MAG: hypothetical protein Q8O95_02555 [bacterium]|nr:hypothetical protein [bacterium]